tara:strand:- start:1647 stop:1856 length:210 start_codon:yes stop_codon:yes gene_type:complete
MADDRHEAYRQMFTRTYIREVLENIEDKQAIASILYDAVESALHTEYKWPHPTVRQIVEKALEDNKRMI